METKYELSGATVNFVCYSVSTGTMTAQWAGKEVTLTADDYKKTADSTVNGFTMDRLVLCLSGNFVYVGTLFVAVVG